MKKILPILLFLLLGIGFAQGLIIMPNMTPPVNSAISPVDINSGTAGYQGYLYQADINGSPGVSPRILIYSTNQSSYPLTKSTIGPSTLGGTPRGLAVTPDGQKLWVALENTSTVKVFDKDGTGVQSVTGVSFGGPKQIAIAPDGERAYVVDSVNYKVYVINTATRGKIDEISISEAGLFGIAISPDNTKLAVGVNALSGKVIIYDIVRNASGTITGYHLNHTITEGVTGNLAYPTYLAFDSATERLFVRVHKNSDPCVDLLIYNAATFSSPLTMVLEDASGADLGTSDYDPGNYLGEALTISGNGQFLYLTHYVASAAKVFVYRVPTYKMSDGTKREIWEFNTAASVGDSIVRQDLAPSKDSIAFQPDGARIWFTFREDGYDAIYTRWTGFTDSDGNISNKLPGAPDIIHPEAPDTMNAYAGNAEWAAGSDDSPASGYRYEVAYRATEEASWHVLEGFTANTTTSLASLAQNHWYLLRVRMYDGALWSNCTYSEPFRKSGAVISGIDIDTNRNPAAQTWTAYNSSSNIGYIYDAIRINGTGFGTVSNPWLNGDTATNKVILRYTMLVMGVPTNFDFVIPGYVDNNGNGSYDAGEQAISSWDDNQIQLVIPRKFKDGTAVFPAEYQVFIKSAGVQSAASFAFKVGPVITTMSPTQGATGAVVDIYGAGFNSSQGSSTVKFYNNVNSAVSVWESTPTGDHIRCTVPTGAADGRVMATIGSIPTSAHYTGNPFGTGYNQDVLFDVKVANPQITGFQVDTNPDPILSNWVNTTEAIIYDHIKIVGTGFGADPGDGNRDTATNRVELNSQVIRDDAGNDGLQVYSWNDTAIEIGIPRRIGSVFVSAGANPVQVRSGGVYSPAMNLNLKPHVYSVTPNEGNVGDSTIVAGTALQGTGSRTVYFNAVSATETLFSRQSGDSPDGTNGNDLVTVTVPTLPLGLAHVSVAIGALTSNNDKTYNVIPGTTPNILQIIPNSAPNTADITATVNGSDFVSGATVVLKKTGETDITGAVTFINAGQLTVSLPITGKAIGKWDVVVTNPASASDTLVKGFTITDGSQDAAQIIDDFEGVAVVYPDGYSMFPSGPTQPTLTISTTDMYEGAQSGSVSYPISAGGYRGINGHCSTMQDISAFTTIIIALKGDGGAGTAKVQITDLAGHNFGAPSNAINLSGTSWAKTTIPMTSFVEIDSSGNPVVGGHTLDKAHITDYQVVFTGNPASLANIGVDFVAAGGYTPPGPSSEITTTIVRAADTVGSAVTVSWVYNDAYVGNADVYTISGAWDAAAGVFSPSASAWTLEFPNVASPVTDNTQVGQGTQKYYKVVKTGVALTDAMLLVDVAGKFDLAVGPSDTQPERALISLPLQLTDNSIGVAFGTQPGADDAIAVIDNAFGITAGMTYNGSTSSWQVIEGITPINSLEQGYGYVYTTLASKYLTVVGHVRSVPNTREIVGGWDTTYDVPKLSWVASAFPLPVNLADTNAGLNGTSSGSDATVAAQIALIDANASILDYALHNAPTTWDPATFRMMPGRGYYFSEPIITSYSWTQVR